MMLHKTLKNSKLPAKRAVKEESLIFHAIRFSGTVEGTLISNTGGKIPLTTEDSKEVARLWDTALKPAHEPIVLARKPLSEKTVAANVLEHGTGALNIDATRVPLV
jgi:hypothetical protein